jgi:trans-aconitate methyltransferase
MHNPADLWDHRYAKGENGVYEPWLDRWKHVLVGHGDQALELGCGVGYDTEVLLKWGFEVIAVDVSQVAVGESRRRNPEAIHRVMDLRGIASLAPGFDVVVASLSLHYFNRKDTVTIFQDVRRLLNPGGILAFRVNAFDDVESGAPVDATNWTRTSVDGVSKQFFTPEKIATVLQGPWRILSQEKLTTHRYGHRKSVFEVIAQVQK